MFDMFMYLMIANSCKLELIIETKYSEFEIFCFNLQLLAIINYMKIRNTQIKWKL